MYSDIVLPAAFFYEKEQFHMLTSSENRFWAFNEKAIEPRHSSRDELTMVHELARKIAERAEERGVDEFEVPHGMTPEKV
ncbi:MAG: molybdopterin-dependent oxidoreductase, partial [Halobacteria archaeon]|nr:molybdopterin-dependent oxidoreductase [Halobacteria archaeon]